MKHTDPTPDIYRIFDEAGFGITKFSTRRSMSVIINEIRVELAKKLKSYIKIRDQQMFEAGYNARKAEEHAETEI